VLTFIVTVPILAVIYLSFTPGLGSSATGLTFENFVGIFQQTDVLLWLTNSLIVSLAVVVVAAISRFASLFDGLAREFLFDPEFRAIVERDLREGQHRNPRHRPHWFTTAFFHHPEELRAEVAEAGLEVVELVGVEGLAGSLPQLAGRWERERDRELILWSARVVEAEPSLLGLSAHLLAVARPA